MAQSRYDGGGPGEGAVQPCDLRLEAAGAVGVQADLLPALSAEEHAALEQSAEVIRTAVAALR